MSFLISNTILIIRKQQREFYLKLEKLAFARTLTNVLVFLILGTLKFKQRRVHFLAKIFLTYEKRFLTFLDTDQKSFYKEVTFYLILI